MEILSEDGHKYVEKIFSGPRFAQLTNYEQKVQCGLVVSTKPLGWNERAKVHFVHCSFHTSSPTHWVAYTGAYSAPTGCRRCGTIAIANTLHNGVFLPGQTAAEAGALSTQARAVETALRDLRFSLSRAQSRARSEVLSKYSDEVDRLVVEKKSDEVKNKLNSLNKKTAAYVKQYLDAYGDQAFYLF